MNRRSILKLLGLAPVAAPAVASFGKSPRVLAHSEIVTPHAQIGPRTVGVEGSTGSYGTTASAASGPVITPPMRVQVGADGRAMLSIKATPIGQGRLFLKRNGQHIWTMPGNFSGYYSDEPVVQGQPTWAQFADRPGPGEHAYTLECDTGGDVALIATVA